MDPMDELAEQLSRFHISARMQKVSEKQAKVSKKQAYFRPRTGGKRSPSPKTGRRSCREPPILDYSWFEELISAQKELNEREGSKDIAWRSERMNNLVEQELLLTYHNDLINTLYGSDDRVSAEIIKPWRSLKTFEKAQSRKAEAQADFWVAGKGCVLRISRR